MIKFHEDTEKLFDLVKKEINKHDPIGLLWIGAPDDEYHPEIPGIVHAVQIASSLGNLKNRIWKVFTDWFGDKTAGPEDRYRDLAKDLWKIRVQNETKEAI